MKGYLDITLDSFIDELSEIPKRCTTYNESEDFQEGGIFADSKFNKRIHDACNATFALCKYSYGVEKDGNIYNVDRSEYPKWYHYLSRDEFNRYKGGLSYDYCRFLYPYFVKKGYNTELYFIEIEGTNMNHTLPMLKVPYGNGFRYVYCEAAFKYICGVYWTSDIDGLLSAIVSAMREFTIITKPTNIVIRKYKPSKNDDMNYAELMKTLRNNEVYDKYTIKPKVSANSSTKPSKFNPGFLSKIDPNIVRLN